ncbi:MAG: hypothetical protein ACPIOQ_80550, partial [Promethearchaeia archaeon]
MGERVQRRRVPSPPPAPRHAAPMRRAPSSPQRRYVRRALLSLSSARADAILAGAAAVMKF